ncbi:metalloendopeptidase [Trichonephila clavipes]|nr:metalloendopeptidase [Trichonephila clavipes]
MATGSCLTQNYSRSQSEIQGAERNFLKLKPWENNLLGEEFDYNSIMLYGEYAFAKDKNSMTMKPKKEGVVIGLINDKPGLSESDVRRINKLYECNGEKRPPPPEVPDFKCDFETDMCGMENHENNAFTNWVITSGTLGGRTGSYVFVDAADASYRKVRLLTPFFGAFGRKKACFKFDVYFNGGGVVSLDVSVHSIHTSKLVMKHVEKKDEWQSVKVDVDLEGDVKFSLDARTRKSNGEGIIALDNIAFQLSRPSPLPSSNVSVQPIECLLPKRPISQWGSFHSNSKNEIFSNFENHRNHSCNHASLPHPLNQSGESYPSRPNHIRPHLTFSIFDGGTLRVPFPSSDHRF